MEKSTNGHIRQTKKLNGLYVLISALFILDLFLTLNSSFLMTSVHDFDRVHCRAV